MATSPHLPSPLQPSELAPLPADSRSPQKTLGPQSSLTPRHRARSARQGYPPLDIPQWFLDKDVTLKYEAQALFRPASLISHGHDLYPDCSMSKQLPRDSVHKCIWNELKVSGWGPDDVDRTMRAMQAMSTGSPGFDVAGAVAVGQTFLLHADMLLVALAYKLQEGEIQPLERRVPPALPSMKHLASQVLSPGFARACRHDALVTSRTNFQRSIEAQIWRSSWMSEGPSPPAGFMNALAAEFDIAANHKPKQRKRPLPVLAITNYTGQSLSKLMVIKAAAFSDADVIHLDIHTLGALVGQYLGQDLYSNKGAFSMMGYRTDEMAGRLVSRYSPRPRTSAAAQGGLDFHVDTHDASTSAQPDPEAATSDYAVNKSQLRSMLLGPGGIPDRWEELKIAHVLEQILGAACLKRAQESTQSPDGERDRVIVHLHDLAELSESREGALIISKLRTAVDRLMVVGGKQIVLIGSTSCGMMDQAAHAQPWLGQLSHLSEKLECHVFPTHNPLDQTISDWCKSMEYAHINMSNITSMLEAMLGEEVSLKLRSPPQELLLAKQVFDIHWAYGIATTMMAMRNPNRPRNVFNFIQLKTALDEWISEKKFWNQNEALKGNLQPYAWPLVPPGTVHAPNNDSAKVSASEEPPTVAPVKSDTEYDHEKQILSGLVKVEDIRVSWNDVVCSRETKESLQALTSLVLTRPEAFSYGVLANERIQGCLLYGPPGTGKTLMAKAIAKESGANMLEVSAASINDRYVGVSEKNVRALFSLAKRMAPAVIFLDEADALLGSRDSRQLRGGQRETINQFLREWDGLTEMKTFIMVATNRPFDLDDAVLRRLPRKILVDLPLAPHRLDILRVLLRDEQLDPGSVSLERLAADTELYSGSDLKNLCVAAAMEAVKDEIRARDASTSLDTYEFPERRVLTWDHFERAIREISASTSPDMDSLKAIRKFDERYGDAQAQRQNKARSLGFAVAAVPPRSGDARVRRELSNYV